MATGKIAGETKEMSTIAEKFARLFIERKPP
jgi:hypothetical protein